jgi:4-alpha-glucanotransferase
MQTSKHDTTSSCPLQDLDRITSPDRDFHASIQFVYYVQYQLHRQLLTVSQYAAEHQVVLKGDLPIGEASSSCV